VKKSRHSDSSWGAITVTSPFGASGGEELYLSPLEQDSPGSARIVEIETSPNVSSDSGSRSSPSSDENVKVSLSRTDMKLASSLLLQVPDFVRQHLQGQMPVLLRYLHDHAMFLSSFWNEPLDSVQEMLRTDKAQGMIRFCSLLSVSFRKERNFLVADLLIQ